MFDTLSDRLRKTLGTLTGRGRISEADVDAAMREVRLALLEADVNFKVVKDFVARVRERAIGADVLESLTAGQAVVKIVHEELVDLLGTGDRVFHLSGNPAVVAMVGLQGSGKTTSTAKLARYVVKQGRRPLLVAADPYRPAAADQLETLGRALDIPVFRAPHGTPVPEIARLGVEAAKRGTRDVVILDTAGRLSVDEALMAEIGAVNDAVHPVETLLVVDAMTGQEAVGVAQAFVAAVPVTGLILTKIDGDARGGAALSISAVTGVPVKFLGTGEKTDALEVFHPDRLAGRILGMGDILTLVERAQETFDVKQAQQMEEKLRKSSFTLEDMLDQLQQVQKMGPIGQLMGMIPGMGNMANEAQAAVDRGELKRTEAIIRAMTPAERRDPTILNGSRRRRIAAGAGTELPEVNRLIKQFSEMQKLMKQLAGGGRKGAMGQLMGGRR
ncbi:MAG TPA: signal recognition particle protein [Candidatus Saccharimonadales bacterium]|nr:signal recognition particle protein [Candidatus Saccharimonadales bacterium]